MDVLKKTNDRLIIFLGAALTLFQIYTALTVTYTAMMQRSIHLGLGLALVYLISSQKQPESDTGKKIQYITNIILAVGSLYACFYVASNWLALARPARAANPRTIDMVVGIILFFLTLLATKRIVGWPLPIIGICFLLYAYYGNYIPYQHLRHAGVDLKRIISMGFMNTEGIFSSTLGASTSQVFIFLLFGQLLESLGGGAFFLDLANAGFGTVRGGPAKVAIFGSALFGSISGSAVANVVGTGTITIPLMKRVGFPAYFAGAVEAVASTGGLIMPPVMGAAAFIMSEVLGMPYWDVCKAAALPAILYYLGLYITIDLRSRKLGLKGIPVEELPNTWAVLKEGGLIYFPPLLVLIYVLGVLRYSADKACIYCCILLVILACLKKKYRDIFLKEWLNILVDTAKISLVVICATACAGIVLLALNTSGLIMKLSDILIILAGGKLWLLLILVMIGSIILGMGLPASACYVILAILAAPSIVKMGVPPVAAHIFVMYFGALSAITPPVALAAFAAAPIAEANAMKIGFCAWKLALPIFLIGYSLAFNPALLFIGSLSNTILVFIFCILGMTCVGIMFEGYVFDHVSMVRRFIWGIAGVFMILPELITSIIGLALTVLLILTDKSMLNGVRDIIGSYIPSLKRQ